MPTAKLFLSQPYKSGATNRRMSNKRTDKVLNPKETRIYVAIVIDRERVIKIRTPFTILPREWDFKKQGKKDILAGSIEFNDRLQDYRKDFLQKYEDTIRKNPDYDTHGVSAVVKEYASNKGKPMKDPVQSFIQILEEYINYLKGEVTPGTVKKFITLKKSLQAFVGENKDYQNLSFALIDHKFKDKYTDFLRNQEPRGRQKNRPEGDQKGLLNDTIGKYIECLKTFCKWAEERGYNKYTFYNQFSNFTKANRKRKKKGNEIVTLTLPELKNLYFFDFSNKPHLERVRDLFCFAVYTGQRWSDIDRLDKRDIHGDIWSFNAFKTKKQMDLDLIGFASPALDILKKYDSQLPKISLTKFNLYIKDAAEIAGIKAETKIIRYVGAKEILITKPKYKFIGSHTARKTCVSILLNEYNLNVTHVLEITGHSDLKTLQKYINKDREARRRALSNTKSISEIMTVKRSNAVI